MKKRIIYSIAFLLSNVGLIAQTDPGDLDPNFNHSGVYEMLVDNDAEAAACVAQPDGKLIIGGKIGGWGKYAYCIRRIGQDGTMDFSHVFAGNAGEKSNVVKLALQPDGKILVLGQLYKNPDPFISETWFYVLRLNEDGTPDSDFGSSGRADFSISAGKVDEVFDFVLLNDNRIVVVSYEHQLNTSQPNGACTILMLDDKGKPDNSFGTNGQVQVVHDHLLNHKPKYYKCTRTIDNRIIIGASVDRGLGSGYDYIVQRYLVNGDADDSFGFAGTEYYATSKGDDYLMDLTVQPDQQILLVGKSEKQFVGNYDLVLLRIGYDAVLDSDFGDQGVVWDNFDGENDNETPVFVNVNSNLKINVVATVSNNTMSGVAAYQFKDDGTLDSTFAEIGKSIYTNDPSFITAADGAILTNNHIMSVSTSMEVIDDGANTETRFLMTEWIGEEIEEVSLKQKTEQKDYILISNPVSEELIINFPESLKGKLYVINMEGQEVYSSDIYNQAFMKIDVSGFSSGIYNLKVTNTQGIQSNQRFIKR
jgi:uncharacterized delta-60 repeat protein